MTKIAKIIGHIVLLSSELIFVFVIIFAFFIRTSSFQTYLAQQAAQFLSSQIGTTVSIHKVDIVFYDRFFVDGIFLEDHHHDTLLHAPEIVIDLDMRKLIAGELKLDHVQLNSAYFNLKKYEGETTSNLQPLLDFFSSDKEKETAPFSLVVNDVELNNCRFNFIDENIARKEHGIDFSHLALSAINLNASDVLITEESYTAQLDRISVKDHSGFDVNRLSATAFFSPKGLFLNDLSIVTPNSKINLSFLNLVTKDYSSYSSFVDNVLLETDFSPSEIALNDVAYFADALYGMDQIIYLEGKTRNTIAELSLEGLQIKTGENTHISGDFKLPDFRKEAPIMDQMISSFELDVSDLTQIKLPSKDGVKYLELPDQLMNLGYLKGRQTVIKGDLNNLIFDLSVIQTNNGDISFLTPVRIENLSNENPMRIGSAEKARKFLRFQNFHLGKTIDVAALGKVNGDIGFELEMDPSNYVQMKKVNGNFRRFQALDYSYQNVFISEVNLLVDLKEKTPSATIEGLFFVRDENLDLVYEGTTRFGEEIDLDVFIDLQCAQLQNMHPIFENRGELYAKLFINGKGKSLDLVTAEVIIDSVYYEEEGKDFTIDHFEANIKRTGEEDELILLSDFLNASINGYVDVDLIAGNMLYQLAQVFPAFFPDLEPVFDLNSKFDYSFDFININPILDVFTPQIQIANNSSIDGSFDGESDYFDLNIGMDYFKYIDVNVKRINLFQELSKGQLLALYQISEVYLRDSLVAQDIHFTNIAESSFMDSHLIFHDKSKSRSNLEWNTFIFEADGFDIDFLPSYFNINNHLWELKDQAHINFSYDCFLIEDFRLERENQFIDIQGQISKVPQDKLNIEVENLDLSDIAAILLPENELSGRAWLSGYIQEPFTELKFAGISNVVDLVIDDREVGNVNFEANYIAGTNSIAMNGDLFFQQQKTFEFSGNYLLGNEVAENLDFLMHFYRTDISVVNSFLDPQVVSGIRGELLGDFELKGTLKEPRIEGSIDLEGGRVNLALLGANFYYSGNVKADRHGIYIDAMPVKDEEGNTGFIVGQLLHDNFSNFLYELNFDFENHPRLRNPNNPSEPLKIDRFLVMKTRYEEGVLYYGNAYMTGSASVSGSADDMTIRVNAKTRRGTWINFPMYGPTTIEEDGFITFKTLEEKVEEEIEKGINFTGVNLSLNFEVTPDARVKLIFDDNIGDEITAFGQGNFLINLDNYGDIALNGTYRLSEGVYNFVMGPYKQNFFIVPGGTVQWTGSPFNAMLDIETYYKTNANLSVVMADVVEGKTSDNEEIYSYLRLRGDMNKPEISFDLAAPRANEAGKAVISRIRSDRDELNRQFFSILIMKRFLPLAGQEGRAQGAGGNAALDLVSTQINSLLARVSDDYKMNVALESDELTGESSVEFGVTKGFMDDRLIVSGSFGVGQYNEASANQNNLIGDVFIEYLINEKGTFRVNVFNESNTNSVMQNTQRGHFTQGVGVNYREDFYNLQDFKLIQFILDLFRKDKNLDYRDQSRFRAIPQEVIDEHKRQLKEDKKDEN